jgi:WD40 repeat protein
LTYVSFSPDGQRVLVGTFGDVAEWNIQSGPKQTFTQNSEDMDRLYGFVSYAPHGNAMAFGGYSGLLQLAKGNEVVFRDPRSGFQTRFNHDDVVPSFAFSPSGDTLVSACFDGNLYEWDLKSERVRSVLKGHLGKVYTVAFSPDGTMIASGGADGFIRIWDSVTSAQLCEIQTPAFVYCVAWAPDNAMLASVSACTDAKVYLWDIASRALRYELSGHGKPVASVAFSPDGLLIASAGGDGRILFWDVGEGIEVHTLSAEDRVTSLSFSPGGMMLASGLDDHTALIWDVGSLQQHRETAVGLHKRFRNIAVASIVSMVLLIFSYRWVAKKLRQSKANAACKRPGIGSQ